MRRFICAFLVCAVIQGCIAPPVKAAQVPGENVIQLEDLEWEWVDISAVEQWEDGIAPATIDSVNKTMSKHSMGVVVPSRFFEANSIVTFDCSYSPPSASMDFGVITSSGRFYNVNSREGSINQAIRISQSGSYSVAIRNNSAQNVTVIGTVSY